VAPSDPSQRRIPNPTEEEWNAFLAHFEKRKMTPADQADVRQLVERYVEALKAQGAIRSPAVERAFRIVERHRLLETFYCRPVQAPDFAVIHHDPEYPRPEHLQLIYSNTALATRVVEEFGARMPASSTSQPSLVAEMLELLDLTSGLRVLEIGAGTGYNAALMTEIVGDQRLVVTVDVADDVVTQTRRLLARAGYPGVAVLARDGVEGAPEQAPFDRIVATVGCSDLSPKWAEQLADGGVLLVSLAHAGGHPLYLLRGQRGRLEGRVVSWTGFMPIRGPLHLDGLWPRGILLPDADEPIHQRDPWPGSGTDEVDFRFYLSLLDRRACWAPGGVGLSDGLNGWAVAGPDGIRWWKDASLVEELDHLHAGWLARGRPTLGDYRVAFVPIAEDAAPPPWGWALDRRFFRELVWLEEP
jgi:protein-L-isoaspartate(D-aspartate) O-methyltransferase